jgi:hypothetical protein
MKCLLKGLQQQFLFNLIKAVKEISCDCEFQLKIVPDAQPIVSQTTTISTGINF